MDNDGTTLATELLQEIKRSAKRWFIAFLVMLGIEICTVIGFLWYLSLPMEDTTVTQEIDNGDNNNVIGIGGYYDTPDSTQKTESDTETEKVS